MAGKPIATVGSMHMCPMVTGYIPHIGGPVSGPGAPNVLINGKPAALMGDMCVCSGPPDTIAQGEPTVLINGTPVATMGSMTAHGGSITVGEPTVMVGSATPGAKASLPLNRIPFPEIRIIDRMGAMMRGRSSDLRQAEANQNQIREEAEESIMTTNLQWQKEGDIIETAMVGEDVILYAEVDGVDDGKYISFKIFEKDTNSEDDFVTSVSGRVQNSMVEISWNVKYIEDKDDQESAQEMQDKGYTLPEYVFKFDNCDGETVESQILKVEDCLEIKALDEETGEPLANASYTISLPNGEFIQGELNDEGYAKLEQLRASKDYPIVFYTDIKVYSARLQHKANNYGV